MCPVASEAGAHGELLGEPLRSSIATRLPRSLRATRLETLWPLVALNAGLMIASAMQWVPPIATSAIKHGLVFLLLGESERLAELDVHANNLT